jgi:transcriptional regulator with GAF, ATPase, and Fis domain
VDRGREDPTEVQRRLELSPVSVRRKPVVSWTDEAGPHREALDGRALVGASPHVKFVVSDRAASRLHAELELRADGHVWVRDLGSTNGTWVDGVFVQNARISPGGNVRIGATTLTVSAASAAATVPLWPHDRFGPLVARSESMRELFLLLAKFATTDSAVLVQGETGTGKELVARAIHEASRRADGPFAVVDCAALPETLLESELFGHTKGAFTGAVSSRAGAFESASGGTVFLDEIGELPLAMQPKLLRVLESQTVRRLGEPEHRRVDVRFVAATNRDLQSMVASGAFREDLYFRLAVLPVFLPPLRERPADVALLLEHFLASHSVQLPPELAAELVHRPWAGNVRELRSFAERVIAVGATQAWAITRGIAESDAFVARDAKRPSAVHGPGARAGAAGADEEVLPTVSIDVPFKALRERWNDYLEREYLTALVRKFGRHDVGVLAESAGLDRSYVHRLLRKHDL